MEHTTIERSQTTRLWQRDYLHLCAADGSRRVNVYRNGRAAFFFAYATSFGPNSAGFERQFQSFETAVRYADTWIAQPARADVQGILRDRAVRA